MFPKGSKLFGRLEFPCFFELARLLTGGCGTAEFALEVGGDLVAMEPAVLDKDLGGAVSRDNDSGQIDPGNIGFERFGVDTWAAIRWRADFDPDLAEKLQIRVIAGEREHKVVLEGQFAVRRIQYDRSRRDLPHYRVEVRLDFAVLDAVFDIGLDPVLHLVMDHRTAMHQRDSRPVSPQLERGNGGGILRADHDHLCVEIRMRFTIIMTHFREVLARYTHHVRQIVKAGG